ncbi:sulfatase [Parashewanella tropica]|uniref:sulfatase n=1 Tax=Parashewanella tropica TaxID=2547970 RepID=UPI001059F3B4|nr:sulfatase [Parashewanella tropica]
MKLNTKTLALSLGSFILSCSLFPSVAATKAPSTFEKQPNIIFILADDQGWKDVGFNGAEFYETPNIDRLASEGMTFTDAYSAGPNCAPTRASFISGSYTPRHKIYTPGAASKGDPRLMKLKVVLDDKRLKSFGFKSGPRPFEVLNDLTPSTTSVAEVLKQAGYTSARFGKWHVGKDTQGFDISSSDGIAGPEGKYYNDADASVRITDASVNFIKQNKDKPFFLFMSYWDVHIPLVADPKVVKKYKNKLKDHPLHSSGRKYNPTYAAMVEAVDTGVGRVLKTLDHYQLDENTLVIYTSDNGGLNNISINAPLRGGKGSLYEGGIRVPFAARWTGTIKPNSKSSTPINTVDMLPTFADIAKTSLSKVKQPLDGISILPALKGQDVESRSLFWHYPLYLSGKGLQNYTPEPLSKNANTGWRGKPASAIRSGDWKLIEYFDDGHLELYNVKQDLSESQNLASQYPKVAKKLQDELIQWRKDTQAVVPEKGRPDYRKR